MLNEILQKAENKLKELEEIGKADDEDFRKVISEIFETLLEYFKELTTQLEGCYSIGELKAFYDMVGIQARLDQKDTAKDCYQDNIKQYTSFIEKLKESKTDCHGIDMLDYIYIELIKLVYEAQYLARVNKRESDKDSFLMRECKILSVLAKQVEGRFSDVAYVIFLHSFVSMDRMGILNFEIQIDKLRESIKKRSENERLNFENKIKELKGKKAFFMTKEEMSLFYVHSDLYQKIGDSIFDIKPESDQNFVFLHKKISTLVALDYDIIDFQDELFKKNEERKKEKARRIEEQAQQALNIAEEIEKFGKKLSKNQRRKLKAKKEKQTVDLDAQIEESTQFQCEVYTPYHDAQLDEASSSISQLCIKESANHSPLGWSDKLNPHYDLLQRLFSPAKNVSLSEICELFECIGGSYKKQKSGIGVRVSLDAQSKFPHSTGVVYTDGTHIPHKARYHKHLSPQFMNKIRSFLDESGLSPDKLWPSKSFNSDNRRAPC